MARDLYPLYIGIKFTKEHKMAFEIETYVCMIHNIAFTIKLLSILSSRIATIYTVNNFFPHTHLNPERKCLKL